MMRHNGKNNMNNSADLTSSTSKSSGFGRIEVVPEVLLTIARRVALRTTGVVMMSEIPATAPRRTGKVLRQDGVLLAMERDVATLDIYIITSADHNIPEIGRTLQNSVRENIALMVGVAVNAIHIHVEDVVYATP